MDIGHNRDMPRHRRLLVAGMHMDVAGTASRVAPSEEEGGAGGTRSDEEESVFSEAFDDDDSEDPDLPQVQDPGLVGMLNFALVEELSPDISKAVHLSDCLEGFGKHWQGQITGGLGHSRTVQEKARQTTQIDDFISHDWSTNGTAKFITLCTLYNAKPAIIIAILVSVAGAVLEIVFEDLRFLPGLFVVIGRERMEVPSAGCFGLLCGMCSYVLTLCFWQRVQHVVCRRSRKVFMDRLCIEQNDQTLKQKGIMGLAGFLKLSKRLVVLWSPRYFTRLWCVYEIARWTKLRKSLRQLIIAPVAQGVFMVLVLGGVFVVMVMLAGLAQVESWEIYATIVGSVTAAIMLAPLYAVRNLVCDLRVMKVQIESFSFTSAECYCCQVGHVIPGTSTRIPCDRQIIGNKLEEWFGPQSSGIIRQGMAKELYLALAKSGTKATSGESAQELFDRYVQEVFGHYILKKVGGSRVSYGVAVATTLPALFYIFDRLHMLTTLQPRQFARLSAHYFAVVLGFFPSLVRLALDLTILADYLVRIRNPLAGSLSVMLLAMCVLTGVTFFWLFLFDYTLFHDQVVYQILMNSATLLVTVALYSNDLSDSFAAMQNSTTEPAGPRSAGKVQVLAASARGSRAVGAELPEASARDIREDSAGSVDQHGGASRHTSRKRRKRRLRAPARDFLPS